MAQGDVILAEGTVFSTVPTKTYQVAASATIIYAGEPVKMATSEDAVVIKCATTEPVTTDPVFVGIAAKDSTNTSLAAGTVEVYDPLPGQVYMCAATTLANIDTQAEYDALVNERIAFDLTGVIFTADENDASATNGLVIVANDIKKHPGMVAFEIRRSVLEKN
jgi:hypothetical protein